MAGTELDPLFTSLNGHIGSEVYYTVGKQVYVRRYVIPHNPKSEAQQSHRFLFAEGMASWKLLSDEEQLVYKKKARELSMHAHNLFIRQYIKSHKYEIPAETLSAESQEIITPQQNETGNTQPCTSSEASPYRIRI